MGAVDIKVCSIRTDGGTQPREALNESTIDEYADRMREGDAFPPIVVFYDDTELWLADGFHRTEAAKRAGRESIKADVLPGDRRHAILFAAGANREHGLPRTNADKRRAVHLLLADAEWSQWSDREIARTVGVDHKTVALRRSELEQVADTVSGEIPQTPDEPAEEPGDEHGAASINTLVHGFAKLFGAGSSAQTQPAPRKFRRGGKTHQQKARTRKAAPPFSAKDALDAMVQACVDAPAASEVQPEPIALPTLYQRRAAQRGVLASVRRWVAGFEDPQNEILCWIDEGCPWIKEGPKADETARSLLESSMLAKVRRHVACSNEREILRRIDEGCPWIKDADETEDRRACLEALRHLATKASELADKLEAAS